MSWFVLNLLARRIPVPSVFVETGAYFGDGIAEAFRVFKFNAIHSIELSPHWVAHCRRRFARRKNVYIHEGDSGVVLSQLIEDGTLPQTPVLFYLDAHYSGGATAGAEIDNGCPVLRELAAIARRNVAGDVVFIDDMRLMGKDSISGAEGSSVYPPTRFDFRHVTDETIRKAIGNRQVSTMEMCTDVDRMLIVFD